MGNVFFKKIDLYELLALGLDLNGSNIEIVANCFFYSFKIDLIHCQLV